MSKRRELDEDDVRIRPGRGKSRPRSKERPSHDDASPGFGRRRRPRPLHRVLGTPATRHRSYAVKARELGRKGVVVGDAVVARRRPARRARHARPDRARRAAHDRRCAAAPTTTTRSSACSSPTPTSSCIVTALADPEPRPRIIDRCLVAAYDAGLTPLLVLTKTDLRIPPTSCSSSTPRSTSAPSCA